MTGIGDAPQRSARSWLVVAFCCLAAVGEGFDLQAPGVTLPVLGPAFQLSTGAGLGVVAGFFSDKSLFLSMSTFGLMLGALAGGRLSDRFGRKWVTIGSVVLFSLLSALTALSSSVEMLLWCRFVTGLGLGGALPNLIAIVAEQVPPARRSTAVGLLYASMPIGGALVSLVSSALPASEWPLIYLLGGALPLLAVPGLIAVLRDAPQPAKADRPARASLGEALFGADRVGRTLGLWAAFFCALIAMYVLLGWLPSLLVSKGLERPQASLVQLAFNLFGAIGSVMAGLFIDRSPRPLSVALVFLLAIIALAALAATPADLAAAFALGAFAGFAVMATQSLVYALAPSCYPAEVRGTGVGFAVAVGRFGSAVGPLFAGAMLGAGASPTRVLGALVPIMVVAGLCAALTSRRPAEV